jgi:hypothetical protein
VLHSPKVISETAGRRLRSNRLSGFWKVRNWTAIAMPELILRFWKKLRRVAATTLRRGKSDESITTETIAPTFELLNQSGLFRTVWKRMFRRRS